MPFYTEVWFITAMSVAGFILLVIFIAIVHKVCRCRALPYEYTKEQDQGDQPSPWQPPPYSADQFVKEDVFDNYLVSVILPLSANMRQR